MTSVYCVFMLVVNIGLNMVDSGGEMASIDLDEAPIQIHIVTAIREIVLTGREDRAGLMASGNAASIGYRSAIINQLMIED